MSGEAFAQISIDPGFPPSAPSQPLLLPIPYSFRTSWDGIIWTDEQKVSARGAISYLGTFFIDEPAFFEQASPDDFTIRWARGDFFRDWGTGTFLGYPIDLNLGEKPDGSKTLAFAAKPGIENPPWPVEKYPLNEIYLNADIRWHYNPFTPPEEGDPNIHNDGEFDFWSVLLHEVIHMLSVNTHASDPKEVMFAEYSDGEQKYELKQSDIDLLRRAGYKVSLEARSRRVPEPTSTLSLFSLGILGAGATLKRKVKRSHSTEKEPTNVG
jgi:hypothetical protein